MPAYFPKKTSQIETTEEIHINNTAYLVTTRISPLSILLFFGSTTAYCLECQIFMNNPVGNIPTIAYDERCSLIRKFERGNDTVSLLKICLSFINQTYPHVQQLTFQDYSYRECENGTIDLASFYYLLYEKTWYMSKMGATFFYPEEASLFNAANARFQSLKQTMSWDDYDTYVTMRHPLLDHEMQELYTASITWSDFFSKLKQRVELSDLCDYMAPWVKSFVKRVAGIQFNSMTFVFCIPRQEIQYERKPSVKRGGTRKQRRKQHGIDLK